MVKLKLRELVDANFQLALRRLSDATVSAVAAWALVKISKTVKEQSVSYEEVRLSVLKKFAALKEDGNIEVEENGSVKFKSEEDKASAVKEIEALLDQEVETPTVKLSAISDAKVEARVLALLEKVIEE